MQHEQAATVAADPHRHGLRHHAGGRTHRIGDVAVFREHHFAAQPARHLAVEHPGRAAYCHHRNRRRDMDPGQPERTVARTHGVDQLVFAQVFAHGGVQNGARTQAHRLAPHVARELFGSLGRGELHLAQSAAQLRGHRRGGQGPVVLQPEHMRGVRRREPAELHQPLALERRDGTLRAKRSGEFAQGLRLRPDELQQLAFARAQLRDRGANTGAERQQHETPVQRTAALDVGQIGREQVQHLRIPRGQQRHRHDALRTDCQLALPRQVNLAVAAQPDGAHVDGPHHGPPAPDLGALFGHPRTAVEQDAQVGRRAADVGQDEALQARQPLRAHQAGRRARQHGLDRAGCHRLGQRQRAVALDDHQRAGDLQLHHGPADGIDQRRDARDQAGVERGGQRTTRGVEGRGQLGRQGDRLAGAGHDQVAHGVFVRGIAHGKGRCDGKRVDLARDALQRGFERRQVQRHRRIAVVVVATGDDLDRDARKRLGYAGAFDHRGIEAHQHHADRAAMAFDHRVGGQRGGHRNQPDVAAAQPLRQLRHRLRDCFGHADGEVALGGDGLGTGQHLVPVRLDDGGVGIGAAGVDTDQVGNDLRG